MAVAGTVQVQRHRFKYNKSFINVFPKLQLYDILSLQFDLVLSRACLLDTGTVLEVTRRKNVQKFIRLYVWRIRFRTGKEAQKEDL